MKVAEKIIKIQSALTSSQFSQTKQSLVLICMRLAWEQKEKHFFKELIKSPGAVRTTLHNQLNM